MQEQLQRKNKITNQGFIVLEFTIWALFFGSLIILFISTFAHQRELARVITDSFYQQWSNSCGQ